MANVDHLTILRCGVDFWNRWRQDNPDIAPDLSNADLSKSSFRHANFRSTNFVGTNLRKARLRESDFTNANLSEANLQWSVLSKSTLIGATLQKTDLNRTSVRWADATGADLTGANLKYASLVGTNVQDAILTGCSVYGVSVWNLRGIPKEQHELIITHDEESVVTVDNLEVAQFVYLLLNNKAIRDLIDTITSKVVLILGRFTAERKPVLDAIRDELRKRDYLPVLFDFEKPTNQTTVETVSTLAHMARFVVADLTDAKSVLQELQAVVPLSPNVVVQPLILRTQEEPGMFDFIRKFPWVLETMRYDNHDQLIGSLDAQVIHPAEAKSREQRGR